MDFFYDTGIYVIIVALAALAVGCMIYILMTKVKIQVKPTRGQTVQDQQEDTSQKSRKLIRFREALKPARRPLKPEMKPPETFIKPEMELSRLGTETDSEILQRVPWPELKMPPDGVEDVMEQLKTSALDLGFLPALPPANEQELQVQNEGLSGNPAFPYSEPGFEQGEEDEEDEGFLLDSDPTLSSAEESESGDEDAVLDLFKTTTAEEDSVVGALATQVEDMEISDLLAEAKDVLQKLKLGR